MPLFHRPRGFSRRVASIRSRFFYAIALPLAIVAAPFSCRPALAALPAFGIWQNGEAGETSATNAAKKLSGAAWPGVIDCLLQRPLPDSPLNGVTIHINYPSIGDKTADADIRAWVTEIADAFEAHLNVPPEGALSREAELDAQINAFLRDDDIDSQLALRDANESAIELFGDYEISRPSANAISVTFELWNYVGSEGNLDIITLNYNLRNGQRLNFVDIFEKPDVALNLLSELSRAKLAEKYGQAAMSRATREGTEPSAENFASLTLTPEGVRVNFQPYQTSLANGCAQKVDIPLADLAPAQPLMSLWDK